MARKTTLTVILSVVMTLFLSSYFFESFESKELRASDPEVKKFIDSIATAERLSNPNNELRGYVITSVDTHATMEAGGKPGEKWYSGTATLCDGVGEEPCRTIKFKSIGTVPKSGTARFAPDWGSTNWHENWILTEQ